MDHFLIKNVLKNVKKLIGNFSNEDGDADDGKEQ